MSRKLLLELVGFQLVWWVSAFGAATGAGTPGVTASAAFVALQTASGERPTTIWLPAAAAAVLGLCTENILVAHELVRYAAPWPGADYAPAWIVALWAAFGTTVCTVRKALGYRPYLNGAALGAALGPASYLAGAGIGALKLGEPSVTSLLSIAVLWGVALPLLLLVLNLVEERYRASTT